jgi:hypothetical protein
MIQSLVLHAVAVAQAESAEPKRHLPIPPAGFAILALVAFLVLLAITWAFRSSGTKH